MMGGARVLPVAMIGEDCEVNEVGAVEATGFNEPIAGITTPSST